jgi:hypothetical protein
MRSADRHRADMYDWMGDETLNEARCQRRERVIAFEGAL